MTPKIVPGKGPKAGASGPPSVDHWHPLSGFLRETLGTRSPIGSQPTSVLVLDLGLRPGALHAAPSEPRAIEAVLPLLLNEIAAQPQRLVLVLDDYHVLEAKAVDRALTFVLEHLPPQLHLVITTREDPQLPIARLRDRGQLTELRAADLRFTAAEGAEFLNGVMGLNLSAAD